MREYMLPQQNIHNNDLFMRLIVLIILQYIVINVNAQVSISDMFEKGIEEFSKQNNNCFFSKFRVYSNEFPYNLCMRKLYLRQDFAHATYFSEYSLKDRQDYLHFTRFMFSGRDTAYVRFMDGKFHKPADWSSSGTAYYTRFIFNYTTNTWDYDTLFSSNHAYFKDKQWQSRSFVAECLKAFYDGYPYKEYLEDELNNDYVYYVPWYLCDYTSEFDVNAIEKVTMRVIDYGTWIKRLQRQNITIVGLPEITLYNGLIRVDLFFKNFRKLKFFKYKDLMKYRFSTYFIFDNTKRDWILSNVSIAKL